MAEPMSEEGALLWGLVSAMTVDIFGNATFREERGEFVRRLRQWRDDALESTGFKGGWDSYQEVTQRGVDRWLDEGGSV